MSDFQTMFYEGYDKLAPPEQMIYLTGALNLLEDLNLDSMRILELQLLTMVDATQKELKKNG